MERKKKDQNRNNNFRHYHRGDKYSYGNKDSFHKRNEYSFKRNGFNGNANHRENRDFRQENRNNFKNNYEPQFGNNMTPREPRNDFSPRNVTNNNHIPPCNVITTKGNCPNDCIEYDKENMCTKATIFGAPCFILWDTGSESLLKWGIKYLNPHLMR